MRKRNTKQYQDFVSLVQIQSWPEEQRFIKRYVILTTVIRTLCISWLFLALCLIILNSMKEVISVRLASPLVMLSDICVLVVWYIYRYYYSAKIVNTWAKDCDIVKYLGIYNELIAYAPVRSNWGVHFYNLSMGLLEAGRSEDAEKVQSLAEQYCTSHMGRFYYEMGVIELAGYRKNYEEMEEHCRRLSSVQSKVCLTRTLRTRYTNTMQYPNYVQMSQNGAYQELYDIFSKREAATVKMSEKVRLNYRLYKIALQLRDEKKAEEHKDFVIQRGGTTRYCTELMNDSSKAEG